ncbi:hypothetical protein K458DRAFT_411645 [Lentithecium fluviatile CBS 122367]|uniref:Uncharacterized protein n=1 Tax=Lentithecium fluviatile CBS 122367 TaxID=1168545 RepID=A0A6G1JN03_9PLEO|nr:hypothetical protein K458DRAFT_411645 [Lentithecium fluviatile CBS 122367]
MPAALNVISSSRNGTEIPMQEQPNMDNCGPTRRNHSRVIALSQKVLVSMPLLGWGISGSQYVFTMLALAVVGRLIEREESGRSRASSWYVRQHRHCVSSFRRPLKVKKWRLQ